jgi:3-hydroxyethyl bacteriochlorophyllide a dehydrogenase
MNSTAVVFAAPGQLVLKDLPLSPPEGATALVDVECSAISTGTERLLWTGDMPAFPGMGYPLVPGYETVGRVSKAPRNSGLHEGDLVFVPGASCYGPVRGLFGGAASRIATAPEKLISLDEKYQETGTLLALAATACHAVTMGRLPELIVGHGVLGRLMARITLAFGGEPTVWENRIERQAGADGYVVKSASLDTRKDYNCIVDASGDTQVLDVCIRHLARHGEVVLAGFYADPLQFVFPPAFMREAAIRIAAQWTTKDMDIVLDLVGRGALSLDRLITHRCPASEAQTAYETAFNNSSCLKMVLDWRACQ